MSRNPFDRCLFLLHLRGLNQYLGCFTDQLDQRDLPVFIGSLQRLTPQRCISACEEQNYAFAGIQYGSECRCGHQYGKYGKASESECLYKCSTEEKCGGDNRNSIYSALNSIGQPRTGESVRFSQLDSTFIFPHLDSTCQNTVIGYQGCFNGDTLSNAKGVVSSIEECVSRCAPNFNYAGIMNG